MKILLIGESCLDVYHYGKCERLCPDAPVPVFKSMRIVENGGMAKNVENNIKSIDKSIIIDCITNENWKSIKKTRYVEENKNHMFLRVDEEDDKYGQMSDKVFNNINFEQYDAVIVSDYNKKFLTNSQIEKISLIHKNTFLDTKRPIDSWSKNFKFIKVNNIEYEGSKKYLDNNTHNLIVTKGPYGCVYKNKVYEVEKVDVKDTSGAGDTFIAGLCVEYCRSFDIDKSINFANQCSTIVVQKKGVATL